MHVGNHQNCTLREVRTPHGFIAIKLVQKFILINRIHFSEDEVKVCVCADVCVSVCVCV